MEHVNVLYTVDKNYFNYMLVSIKSLLENNRDLVMTIHIIYDGLTNEDFNLVKRVVKESSSLVEVKFYAFEPIKKKIERLNMPKWNNSLMPNARLFFDSYIDADENLLYADSDTIFTRSIEGLKKYNGTISMVNDPVVPKSYWEGLKPGLGAYYNSGAMWINLNKWRANNCQERIIAEIEKNPNHKYPDQDIINKALSDQIEQLPANYNVFSVEMFYPTPILFMVYDDSSAMSSYSKSEIRNAKRYPIILHSTPLFNWKGWTKKTLHPYRNYYANYSAKIGFDLIENDEKVPNEIIYRLAAYLKGVCPDEIKAPIKEFLKKVR